MVLARISMIAYGMVCALTACNADSGAAPVIINSGSLTEIQLPEILRIPNAIDPQALQLQVRVNNSTTVLERLGDDLWSGSVDVPVNQSSSVYVEWGMQYGDSGYLTLARQQQFVDIRNEERTVTFNGNYFTDYDNDRDGLSNLEEIKQNRSPVNYLDVWIGTAGSFLTGGVDTPRSDECGSKIPMSTILIPPALIESTLADEQMAEDVQTAWWCAILKSELEADGVVLPMKNIEILVNVFDGVLWNDSLASESHKDDSVEIFIDGDNNKRGNYDGINDYQFRFIPVGDIGITSIKKPLNTQVPHLTGVVSYFNGGYQFRVSVPIAEVGISLDTPFGLSVEVNHDDDGGDRDRKYGWVGSEGQDISFRNTSSFGTAQAQF